MMPTILSTTFMFMLMLTWFSSDSKAFVVPATIASSRQYNSLSTAATTTTITTTTTTTITNNFITQLNYCNDLPTVEQVSTDSFTEQYYHASSIVREIEDSYTSLVTDDDMKTQIILQQLLVAQLSHQDGIRGFFAVYLTREGKSPADTDLMPVPLSQAIKRVDMEKLAPLACMNVIRPVAMASIHSDPVLATNSAKTAERAKRIWASLQGSVNVVKHHEAVHAAASGKYPGGQRTELIKLWESIFDENDYDEKQRAAIAKAFSKFDES